MDWKKCIEKHVVAPAEAVLQAIEDAGKQPMSIFDKIADVFKKEP
ncbi:MAG: hypothetical protein NTU41_04465 [Chloroflexi bacterium]|nr:hypothetical protein [Chloroflexota bacterium]